MGAVLVHFVSQVENVLGYDSHSWSGTDSKERANSREPFAVLWVVNEIALPTSGCGLQSHHGLLCFHVLLHSFHHWALHLMELDMELKWRPGVQQRPSDTLSRAPRTTPRGYETDDSFSGDRTTV